MLRKHQQAAIDLSIRNNFSSGIHSHATGTGKSIIGLELVLNYNTKYPENHVLWFCEQKACLTQLFNYEALKHKQQEEITKRFNIFNFSEKKTNQWVELVNNTHSRKPMFIIINRAFLVSKKRYENLSIIISLIIHDECHTAFTNTTKAFYDWLYTTNNAEVKCIGLSATPNVLEKPYDTILSHYSIYDAFCDNMIVPPKIKWIKSKQHLSIHTLITICKEEIEKLLYKKIIVWCRLIDICQQQATIWKRYFPDYLIAVDTSKETKEFATFNTFEKCHSNAILFCASKHREGSDIKHLDGCIFLDGVSERTRKTFVQCIGRVLRINKSKTYGLILDLYVANCIELCDRVNKYLSLDNSFPWKYETEEHKEYTIKTLTLTHNPTKNNELIVNTNENISLNDYFKRECPKGKVYKDRLNKELDILKEKQLDVYLLRAVNILELTGFIPHVTRGSSGSSLVCYLLGISNVDPVEYNIKFERFLNKYRHSLPDIDLDFPYDTRDEVYLKLQTTWPNKVARISNHVMWQEKSARREALRRIGYKGMIPKEKIISVVRTLNKKDKQNYNKIYKELLNSFRHYSLHCGGIVFFDEGIPSELILNKSTISQVNLNRDDVSKLDKFKIDILSSRAISQLRECDTIISFDNFIYDKDTFNLLAEGNNIGITLGESPLMRKALLKIKPKNIYDIAVCLSIIRPAAKEARNAIHTIDFDTKIIFDDDAIDILSTRLNISLDLADKFRRCLAKDKWTQELKVDYHNLLSKLPTKDKEQLQKTLKNLRLYSFCKSHAMSYAQLVYKLAYQKLYNTKAFWEATLKHNHSSYRKWVHMYEARLAGVDVMSNLKSNPLKQKKQANTLLSNKDMLRNYGYWNMKTTSFYPNCYFYKKDDIYYYSGLIASQKMLNYSDNSYVFTVCVYPQKYIEILTSKKYFPPRSIGLKGRAKLQDVDLDVYKSFIHVFY